MKLFLYKLSNIFQILYFFLLKIITIKRKEENYYNFFYDFNFVNANYDFIVFLIVAAIKSKNKPARIYFLFKSKFANARNKEKNVFGEEYQSIKFNNIILKLAKTIKGFDPEIIILKDRNSAKKIYLSNKFNFPKYNIFKNGFTINPKWVFYYGTLNRFYRRYNYLPRIVGKKDYDDKIKFDLLRKNINEQKLITLTLRRGSYQIERNSNLESTIKFAYFLKGKGFVVAILDDYEKILENLDVIPKEFRIFDEAVIDLYYRISLYQTAKLNIIRDGGVPACMIFSENIDYLLFKEVIPIKEYATDMSIVNNFHKLKIGDQYSFSKKKQKIIWKKDTYNNFIEAYNKFNDFFY
jgi:hypothetical protein